MSNFEQIKPDIIRCFNLQEANECDSTFAKEQWKKHPYYPKEFLLWADFHGGEYTFRTLKVFHMSDCEPGSDQLCYTIGRIEVPKKYSKTFKSVDSKAFEIFKDENGLDVTPYFRGRMDILIDSINLE
jgi:hypothetical protein